MVPAFIGTVRRNSFTGIRILQPGSSRQEGFRDVLFPQDSVPGKITGTGNGGTVRVVIRVPGSRYQIPCGKESEDPSDRFLRRLPGGIDHQFRVQRFLVGIGNPGELRDLAGNRPAV